MPTRLLIVDDSPLIRDVLRAVLAPFSDIEIVGEAADGLQAEAMIRSLEPDVVTMDVVMPMMSGLETIERIMAECPTPIVVVADAHGNEQSLAMEALDRGALEVFPKPATGFDARNGAELAAAIQRAARVPMQAAGWTRPRRRAVATPVVRASSSRIECIGIVGSTGSPRTLKSILAALPSGFSCGIAVVQHTARGFTDGLASWLDASTPLQVLVGRDGHRLRPGQVLVAPDDAHMEIAPGGVVRIRRSPPVDGHRPSATALLSSLAQAYGPRAVGVVLSGMGRDGASGLAAMEAAGALVIVESPEQAVVGGMPRQALELTRSAAVIPAADMGPLLARLVRGGAP